MDIFCRRCGEPWDIAELHDTEDGLTYDEAVERFNTEGCGAVFGGECAPVDGLRTSAAGVLADLLGDDVDGQAAMMEDCEAVGLLRDGGGDDE